MTWQYKFIPSMTKGMDRSKRSDTLEDGNTLLAENIYFNQDQVVLDSGYTTFAGTVRGTTQRTHQFKLTNGTTKLVLITTATFYVFNSSEWQYVSDGTSTTCTDGEPAGETNIVVADITGFSDTDYIGITLDDGTQHQTTINGVPAGTTIVITDAIPVGRTVSISAALVKAVDYTGSLDKQVSITTYPANDWLIFTNGINNVQRYDGTTIEDVPNLPSSGNTQCVAVATWNNYVVLMGMTEGGTDYPQRVRRCDTADPTNWTTGNAGFDDIYDDELHIKGGALLGPYLVVYKEGAIVRGTFVGTADQLFDFETVVSDTGLVATCALVGVGDVHYLQGEDNFYQYDGGFSVQKIGNPIKDLIFGNNGELNPSNRGRSCAVYSQELNEVWFLYPHGSETTPKKAARLNLNTGAWSTREYGTNFIGSGKYIETTGKSWNDLVGSWDVQTFTWNSSSVTANSPIIQLCSNSTQVYKYDYVSNDDNGVGITYNFITPKYVFPQGEIRVDRFDTEVKGNNVSVYYSIDDGVNWSLIATMNPGSTFDRQRFFQNFTTDRVQFRYIGTGGGFGAKWYGFKYTQQSEN